MIAPAKKTPALLIGVGEAKPESDAGGDDDAGALAGQALAKAIKSGDGAAIYSAFEAMYRECKSAHETSESTKDEMDEGEAPM